MQWEKFKTFSANHLDLAPCLTEHLQPIADKRTMKDIVEQQLEYIAVRPWDSLNLEQKGGYRLIPGGEASVTYTVYAHIEGSDLPCARARSSYGQDDKTVRQLIDEFIDWHKSYWAKQDDRPIVFDAVVRRSKLVHYGKVHPSADKKALSFYLFPLDFTV